MKSTVQCIAVALENYFPIPCKVSFPCAYTPVQSMRMGTRLCKEWENNFPTQLQCTVIPQACGQSREFPSIFIGVSVKGVARKSRREKRGPTNSSSRTSALSDEELL